MFQGNIFAAKEFTNNTDNLGQSLTGISLSDRLEQTIIPITENMVFKVFSNQTFTVSTQDDSNPVWNSNVYSFFESSFGQKFAVDRENILWGGILDKRPKPNTTEIRPTLLTSDSVIDNPDAPVTALSEPSVYRFDRDSFNGQGEALGTIPTSVVSAHDAIMYTDLFAHITIREAFTFPEIRKTFYFNPDDPKSVMQLMYEEEFEK